MFSNIQVVASLSVKEDDVFWNFAEYKKNGQVSILENSGKTFRLCIFFS